MIGFHLAPCDARGAIRRRGLRPAVPERWGFTTQPWGVYFWPDAATARGVWRWRDHKYGPYGERCDIWRAELSGLSYKPDPLLSYRGAFYVPGAISPDRLELVERPPSDIYELAPSDLLSYNRPELNNQEGMTA